MIDLEGQVVLVTGASTGIGAQVARAFGAAGAAVVVHARREDARIRGVVTDITAAGGRAVPVTGDLAGEAVCVEVVEQAVRAFGRLDTLVNNAGVQPVQALETMSVADWRAVVDVNLGATFACTPFAARHMRAAGGGSVIHIASIEGSLPAYGHAHYAASKAAIIMHARAAALEYGRFGIRVNTVSPGLIARPSLEEDWPEGVGRWLAAAPLGRLGTGMDVANACLFLASPLASWITGQNLVVDGGMSAHPAW